MRIGITDYAQDALGDVVFVELPEVGRAGRGRRRLSEVESTKSVSDIYAPVAGTVVEVNAELADAPERLNEDPYGEGWICVIELADPAELDGLLDAAGLPRAGRGLSDGVADVFCNQCGHRNPLGLQLLLVVRRAARARAERPHHHVGHASPLESAARRDRGRARRPARRRRACSSCARGPERRAPLRCSTRTVTTAGRHPDSDIFLDDITVSRRHAEVRADRGRLRASRDVGSLNGTYLNRERVDEADAAPTATSSRSASSAACSSRSAGREPPRWPDRSHLSIGEVLSLAPGRVPRRHDLEDPLPREPGPDRPRAHAVGLPEVLRGRRRAAAVDPAPAARPLPAAEGDQGPPRGRAAEAGAARRARPAPGPTPPSPVAAVERDRRRRGRSTTRPQPTPSRPRRPSRAAAAAPSRGAAPVPPSRRARPPTRRRRSPAPARAAVRRRPRGAAAPTGAARSGRRCHSPAPSEPARRRPPASFTLAELCGQPASPDAAGRPRASSAWSPGAPVGRRHVLRRRRAGGGPLAAGFVRFGIEPRHLRMYKVAAEREAGLLEQVVMPLPASSATRTARQQAGRRRSASWPASATAALRAAARRAARSHRPALSPARASRARPHRGGSVAAWPCEMELVGVGSSCRRTPPSCSCGRAGDRRVLPIFIGGPRPRRSRFALEEVETPRPDDPRPDEGPARRARGQRRAGRGHRAAGAHLLRRARAASAGDGAPVSRRPSDAIALAVRTGTPDLRRGGRARRGRPSTSPTRPTARPTRSSSSSGSSSKGQPRGLRLLRPSANAVDR